MKKILIIRFSSIGDIVLTTPLIRCLKQQVPDAEIHYLTKEKFYPILIANPYIDQIHTFNDALSTVLKPLKEEKFDFIVDLHKNLRSFRVKLALRRPTGTLHKLNFEKWLLVNLKVNRLPQKHIVDRYFEALGKLEVTNDHQGLDYFIPADESLVPDDLPENFRDGFIAFVIGGMHHTKMYPEDKVAELCRLINKPIILMGGTEDADRADRIMQQSDKMLHNACGRYTINQSASIIRMASYVITNDTGLMHIAAAFSKDIHSFWGNTIPEFGMYPYLPEGKGSSTIYEVADLKCRPCSKIGYESCPKKHFRCMTDIEVNRLIEAIKA
ncbi:MAG: glycosyltransferase family 9 protein [Bacteroidota bacterium]